jgi:hypothetical protein
MKALCNLPCTMKVVIYISIYENDKHLYTFRPYMTFEQLKHYKAK